MVFIIAKIDYKTQLFLSFCPTPVLKQGYKKENCWRNPLCIATLWWQIVVSTPFSEAFFCGLLVLVVFNQCYDRNYDHNHFISRHSSTFLSRFFCVFLMVSPTSLLVNQFHGATTFRLRLHYTSQFEKNLYFPLFLTQITGGKPQYVVYKKSTKSYITRVLPFLFF